MVNRQKNNKLRNAIVISVGVILIIGIMVVLYLYNASKWEYIPLTEQDKVQIATTELLLPELSGFMNREYKRSFREISYLYDTDWFDSVEQLFSVLNYADENERMKAIQNLQNNKIETLRFDSLEGGVMDVYQIFEQDLPLQNEELRGNDTQNYYTYEYYVIVDTDYDNLAKLICIKEEY